MTLILLTAQPWHMALGSTWSRGWRKIEQVGWCVRACSLGRLVGCARLKGETTTTTPDGSLGRSRDRDYFGGDGRDRALSFAQEEEKEDQSIDRWDLEESKGALTALY